MASIGIVLSIWSGYDFNLENDSIRLLFLCPLIFIFCSYMVILAGRFKINVYNDRIHRIGIFNRIILFSDVKTIFITEHRIDLKSGFLNAVSVTKDLENKDKIVEYLYRHFKDDTDIKIWGDNRYINQLRIRIEQG